MSMILLQELTQLTNFREGYLEKKKAYWKSVSQSVSLADLQEDSINMFYAGVLVYVPTDPSAFLSNYFKNLHIPKDLWSPRKAYTI
ncbi:uncharacterized protein ACIBXB_009782 isoform 3-T4 [Morphnus guianensis]